MPLETLNLSTALRMLEPGVLRNSTISILVEIVILRFLVLVLVLFLGAVLVLVLDFLGVVLEFMLDVNVHVLFNKCVLIEGVGL